ncbi:SDR family oxidoreductase [Leifsonia sp. NPDC058292]|uniref:SDR family oxidoreductase n=1 Tax=Leifsonia sp. NPDC058292 TaxID=3346428 RepID=UPI0036DD5BCA
MKVVVAGGTGLIGTKVVDRLRMSGHDVVVASRKTGVNLYTSEGLEGALDEAEAVVDVSNSPYADYEGALDFFETATLNLLTFGAAAGVRHHVVLSVVGTDRLARAGGRYFQAKAQQERLVTDSGIPFSIVHSTQFFEFARAIADSATEAGVARVVDALVQPIAADDVATAVVGAVLATPTMRTGEIAGPDQFRLGDLVSRQLLWSHDAREVAPDAQGDYFGAKLADHDLLPGLDAAVFRTHFTDWLAGLVPQPSGERG